MGMPQRLFPSVEPETPLRILLCLNVLCLSLMAESISLDHANPNPAGSKGREDKPSAGPLSDDIHPPPTILNIDLVRMLDRHLSRAPAAATAAEERPGGGSSGCGLSRASTDERLGGLCGGEKGFGAGGGCGEKGGAGAAAEGPTSSKGGGEAGGACASGQHDGGGSGRLPRGSRASGGVLDIGPTRTMHLQMTPMVCVSGLLTWGF